MQNSGNYYTIFNTDTGAAFNNVSPGDLATLKTSYKSGMGIDQKIVKDTATNKGKAKQTLNFKAWLVGAADAPDLGTFEANTTFQITCSSTPASDTAAGAHLNSLTEQE